MVNPPKKGTTKEQFNRYFSNRVFYYLPTSKYGAGNIIYPCVVTAGAYNDDEYATIMVFDNCWNLKPVKTRTLIKWIYLFNTYEDAEKVQKHLKKLYNGFKNKPYISASILEKYKSKLMLIEKSIQDNLKDYNNFDGIDFCDVNAGGIQIRGHHKDIKNYCFGEPITIRRDFSNYKDVISKFVDMWKSLDNDDYISSYKKFLINGEKYGWD